MTRREFLVIGSAAAVAVSPFLQSCSRHLSRHDGPPEQGRKNLLMGEIPTVELHRHFEAGMSPDTIATLAQRNNVTQALTRNSKTPIEGVDPQDTDSIREYYQGILAGFKSPDGFSKFLDSLGLPVAVMCSLEDLQYAAHQQILEQAKQGSLHTELRGSPYTYQENLRTPATLEEIMAAIRSGIRQAYGENGASGTYIACISRNKVDKYGDDVVKAILATHTSGYPMGFDIAGAPENKFPPAMFENLVKPLREAKIPITIHAGEQSKPPDFPEAPSSFVKDAIDKLGAQRIGHGLSLIADPKLLASVRDRGVCVETCPASNEMMGYIPLSQHPLREFLDARLSVTLDTDDPLMLGVSSVRDIAVNHGEILRLTPDDLVQITRNGIAAAFVTPERRAELERKFDKFISQTA